jgi:hypothetical protein
VPSGSLALLKQSAAAVATSRSRPPPAKIKAGQSSTGDGGERDCRPKKFGGVQETKQVNTRFRAVVSQEDERNRMHSGSSSQRPLGQSSRVAFRLTGTSSCCSSMTDRSPDGAEPVCLFLVTSESWRLPGSETLPKQRSNGEQPQGSPGASEGEDASSFGGHDAADSLLRHLRDCG